MKEIKELDLDIYRITLLSNNSGICFAPTAVLDIYRITLLSNCVVAYRVLGKF